MTWLPDGRKEFKIGLAVVIQYRRVTDSQTDRQTPSHVAVANLRTRIDADSEFQDPHMSVHQHRLSAFRILSRDHARRHHSPPSTLQ